MPSVFSRLHGQRFWFPSGSHSGKPRSPTTSPTPPATEIPRGGNPTVLLIHSPIALAPVVELAGPHAQPLREASDADLGLLRPTSDKIHHLIPHIMRHPSLAQSSPRLFLSSHAPPSFRPVLCPYS